MRAQQTLPFFRISSAVAIVAVASIATLAACGGPSTNVPVEPVVEEEPVIEDIPGVVPAALAAFNEGIRALRGEPRDYVAAETAFERAVEADPDFWEAWENLGLVQMDLGRYRDAIRSFEEELSVIDDLLVREWPVDPRPVVHLNIAKARAMIGDFEGAADALVEILRDDPKNVEARANLAAVYLEQENFDQARLAISELLEQSQNDVGALNVLAQIYKREGDMQMAMYLWEKALGEIARTREALQDEEQYEDMDEESAERLRSYNLHRDERLDQLLSDVLNEIGLVRWQEERHDAAELTFRRSIENNPGNVAAHTNLAALYLEYANFEDSCSHYAEVLALRPRAEEAMVGFASCTYGQGDVEGAIAAYEHAISEHPNNEDVARKLGDIYFQDMNDLASALQWYNRNLQIRGLNTDTCDRSTDPVCAAAKSLIEMRQSDQPRTPPADGEGGE